MKKFMEQQLGLAKAVFLFSTENWQSEIKKTPCVFKGGQADGYERDRVLDSQLSGLFKHIHGGRDVECNTKERLVLNTFANAIESYF